MSAAEARRDLILKLNLEKKLAADIARINNKLISTTIEVFARDGVPVDADIFTETYEQALATHYTRTGEVFMDRISQSLPADIVATTSETALITASLAGYYTARAVEQSRIITETNQRNAIAAAREATETRNADGQPLPRRDQAREAGVRTSRKLAGRSASIATTETQNAAETAKAVEADVLSGRQPAIVAGSPQDAQVDKEWVTVGDSHVRDSHVAADSQTQDLAKPFKVEGQLLMYPGDTSRGASAGNIINCRCSSVAQRESFLAIRRKPGFAPVTETVPTEQLLESLGQ